MEDNTSAVHWHRVMEYERLVAVKVEEIIVAGDVLALFENEGQIFAIDGMCHHQGGPLARGTVKDGCVTCPWHGWQYDLATGNNVLTGRPMLSRYATRVVDGWVEIEK